MSVDDFFNENIQKRVSQTVQTIESQTSAEIVVAVFRQSTTYRETDWLLGAGASFLTLALLLFLPIDFAVHTMPLDVLVGFGLGAFISTRIPALKRHLVPERIRREAVRGRACATFIERGIGRTRDRNGVLVVVSMLEREVQVVVDVGITPDDLGDPWRKARHAMAQAVLLTDVEAFLTALGSLGPVLGSVMPRRDDDLNELPDGVVS